MDADRSVQALFALRTIRPDGLVKRSTEAAYVGNNIYNTTGTGQARVSNARRLTTKSFLVKIQNDGNPADAFKVLGTGSSTTFTIKYLAGTTNVTTAVRAGTYTTSSINPLASKTLKVMITVKKGAKIGTLKKVFVTISSISDPAIKDKVVPSVKVIR
jgi:hypothetical protein